ncbi:MAG: hypothetical protein KJ826_12330 [Proteobacteria bacterium]|nr:hypothetical protein [Pseudomonadota bacterium]MBU4034966.1 hypothetical protein [Pseudomonadota bacterium]
MGQGASDDQKQLPSVFKRTDLGHYPAMARYLREPPGADRRVGQGSYDPCSP